MKLQMKKRHYRKMVLTALLLGIALTACSAVATQITSEPVAVIEQVDAPQAYPAPTQASPAPAGVDADSPGMDSPMGDADTMEENAAHPEDVNDSRGDESISEADRQRAVELIAADEEMAAHLASYPDWVGEVYREDDIGAVYYVDFYSPSADEWLGYGVVDITTGEIREVFAPRELTEAEFQAGAEKVRNFVLNDAEVLALLGDLSLWDSEVWYNRWDTNWEMWFWRGLDEYLVLVYMDEEDDWMSLEIIDPAAFEAEEQEMLNRNQAVELAWEAEGIDAALAGADDWTTYVENQGGSQWSVSFVSGGNELFFALVDIESWEVLEAGP